MIKVDDDDTVTLPSGKTISANGGIIGLGVGRASHVGLHGGYDDNLVYEEITTEDRKALAIHMASKWMEWGCGPRK